MICVFIFGAIIGSFLDVVAYRLHTGKSLNGRSHCLSCNTQLKWYELIPVVSYLSLLARCRTCGAHIPWRCLIMEVVTGLSFLYLYTEYLYEPILFVLYLVVAALLILIVAYDLRHMIIPDELVLALGIVSIVVVSYTAYSEGSGWEAVLDHGAAALAGGAFFASFWLVSKGRWMGLGDAKLMLPLGLLLGLLNTLAAIVLAFWIGAAISVCIIAMQHLLRFMSKASAGTTRISFFRTPLRIKSEIPFAPFLVLGFSLVHFFHVDLFQAFPLIYPF